MPHDWIVKRLNAPPSWVLDTIVNRDCIILWICQNCGVGVFREEKPGDEEIVKNHTCEESLVIDVQEV